MGTYLDKAGLQRAFTKLKSIIDGKAAANHTHTGLVSQSTSIDNNTDWTTITTTGIYSVAISDLTNAKNYPSGMYPYGDLYVQNVAGHITQIYWSHQGDCFERQAWSKTNNVWFYGSWYKIYTTKNKPSWSDVTGKPSFAAVATSGSYNDLSDKPSIPSVGNGTVTITQGNSTKGTFTMNQSGNTTIALTDNNTTYSANNGVSLSGTTFSNSGVRSIATGGSNGTISVNTGGSTANVAVKGLGSAAYTASTAYAAADVITISSTQPTSSTCKMWFKI